jgi:septum formation topological specificity factor MinE
MLIPNRCFGAASAKKRLDVVIRDAINAGDIPGPRYLANGQEMARRDGELVGGITAFADGPDEMRKVIREHVEIGVDNIKLSMSGEEVSRNLSGITNLSVTVHADPSQTDHRDSISP